MQSDKDLNPFPAGYSTGPFSAHKGLPAPLKGTLVLQQGFITSSCNQVLVPLTVLSWDSREEQEG